MLVLQVGEELGLPVEVRPAALVGFLQGLDGGTQRPGGGAVRRTEQMILG